MKYLIAVCILLLSHFLLTISSLPVKQPPALTHEFVQTDTGYRFKYEVGDGTIREEVGEYKTPDGQDKPLSVKGYYSYYLDDDSLYHVDYKADENGYQEVAHRSVEGTELFINKNALISLVG